MNVKKLSVVFFVVAMSLLIACGGSGESNASSDSKKKESTSSFKLKEYLSGDLGSINEEMATEGEAIYNLKCTACHTRDTRLVGPPLANVTTKRTPNWLMNIMLHNEEMVANDPDAKAIFEEYNKSIMLVEGFEEEDARKVLEYLRKLDGQ